MLAMNIDPDKRRCLILSYVFYPSVGGIESVSELLAGSLTRRGYEVRVVTDTCADRSSARDQDCAYGVIRRPTLLELCRQLRWCDVVLQSNISLRLGWPLICGAVSKPWIVVHHTPIARPSGRVSLRDRLKLWGLRHSQCYAVSNYLASIMPGRTGVLPNPYDDRSFRRLDDVQRHGQLVFLGRLVPAKGVDILLRALGMLRHQGIQARLTIVGVGPEEQALRQLAKSLNIEAQVQFAGLKRGAELVRMLNEHQILVIPSRPAPPEALGIVALEGIACGCVVVGAHQGGLPEAIGPCGVTFESESVVDLAAKIRSLLESPSRTSQMLAQRESFLDRFRSSSSIHQYELAIEQAISAHARQAV
jgi:glycosyltransferase involved in cell wall biosynthesis